MMTPSEIEEKVQDIKAFGIRWRKMTLQEHQLDWLRFLLGGKIQSLLLSPRRHGKSETLKIYLLYELCNNPHLKIMIVSNTEGGAARIMRGVRILIQSNEELREAYGLKMGKPWTKTECYFGDNTEPSLMAKSTGAKVAGASVDLLLCDDLIESSNISTPAQLRKVKDWIYYELFNCMNPRWEKIIIVGTRKGANDWYNELMDNPDVSSRIDRAITTDDDGIEVPLWSYDPETKLGFSMDKLLEKKRRSPEAFSREWLQEPVPPDGYRFDREWVKFYKEIPQRCYLNFYMGIDPGYGLGERASSFAVTVVAQEKRTEKIFVIEMFKAKLGVVQQVEKAHEMFLRWEPDTVMVESVMMYAEIARMFEQKIPRIREVDYTHTKLKGTDQLKKELRIESRLVPIFRNGLILLKNPENSHFSNLFIETELMVFGGGGHTDMDLLDSLVLAVDDITFRDDREREINIVSFTPKMW